MDGINSLGQVWEEQVGNQVLDLAPDTGNIKDYSQYDSRLVGFITGDRIHNSLDAGPYSGREEHITAVIGPYASQLDKGDWYDKPVQEFHFLRLGQVFNDRDEHKVHNGFMRVAAMLPVKHFSYLCSCGKDNTMLSSFEMLRRREFGTLVCSCGKLYVGVTDKVRNNDFRNMDKALAAHAAVVAYGGPLKLTPLGGDFTEISSGAEVWRSTGPVTKPVSVLTSRLIGMEGRNYEPGAYLTSGYKELRPRFEETMWKLAPEEVITRCENGDPAPTDRDLLTARMRQAINRMKAGKATVAHNVMPRLLGVFPAGKAPGNYEPTFEEQELIGAHALHGEAVEVRHFRHVRGMRNLKCEWRWLVPNCGVGWIPEPSLSLVPDADAKGLWNPGFNFRLVSDRNY